MCLMYRAGAQNLATHYYPADPVDPPDPAEVAYGPQLATPLPRAGGKDAVSSKETPSNHYRIAQFGTQYLMPETCYFEVVCLTTVILAPGARKGGCELPAKFHLIRQTTGKPRVPRGHFLCAGALLKAHLPGKGRPFWTPRHPKLHLGAQGAPNGPTASRGSQREAKVTPRRAPWEPKPRPKRRPKVGPRKAK